MKKLLLTVALVCGLLVARAEAQTSPSCDQVPNLGCVAGDTWTGDHNWTGAIFMGSSNQIAFEGTTDDAIQTFISVTDPTTTNKTFTIPNFDTVAVQPKTCSGTDKVSALNPTTGELTCSADQDTGGTGDSIQVGGLAATDANFIDSTWIDFVLDTGPTPDTITANIIAASITATELGTDSVAADEIAANAVGASEIATDAVGADEIATDAVGAAEIATGAVGTAEIADGVIVAADISDTGYLTWNEAATGSGNTRTISAEPRQIVANRDAILVVGNGLVQRQVPATPSLNEFTRSTTTLTWNAGIDPGNVVVWYELPN